MGSTRRLVPSPPGPGALANFFGTEAAGGVVLVVAAASAVAWASSPWSGAYHSLFESRHSFGVLAARAHTSVGQVIDDALMVLFFLVVGAEVKREWVLGSLRDRRAAAVPVLAALGGMVVPAALYAVVTAGHPGSRGWGIPMATDISFVLGVAALLGRRIPASLRVFLLTLAVADDIGAIGVIAVFYAGALVWAWLGTAVALVLAIALLHRRGKSMPWLQTGLGVALWWCTLRSGIHPTIAGVVLGLLLPAQPGTDGSSPVDHVMGRLHPWTSLAIVPMFALANAGVDLSSPPVRHPGAIAAAVVLGLVVGKTVGIVGGSWLVVKSGLGRLPEGIDRTCLLGGAALGGIGFTVSLFVADLALPQPGLLAQARAGILFGSVLAAVVGSVVLALAARRRVRADAAVGSEAT